MAYQVLARKWRPQQFEDVLGQQAVTRTLKNALKSKRIAQAFVFSGPRGCGKTTTRAHPGARAQLRERADARSVRRLRRLHRDRRRPRHRRARDRRRHPHRRRQRPRGDHRGPVDRAGAQPLQGLHHRRSPHAVGLVVQRAAEVDRGAAAARHLHDGDDRAAQDSRHGAVALAGLRVQDHLGEDRRRSAALRSPSKRRSRFPTQA